MKKSINKTKKKAENQEACQELSRLMIKINQQMSIDKDRKFRNLFAIYQLGDIVPLDGPLIMKTIDENLRNPNRFKYLRDYYKSIAFYNLGHSFETTMKD